MPTTSAPTGLLGPVDIELQADIRAPAELVWRLLVDWENMGRWMLEATRFRVRTEHREGIGVEIEAKVRIGGITTTDTVRVTRWEPPRVLSADHLGWVKGHAVMQCIPTAGGTRLEWTERLVPPLGVLGGIGIRVLKPLMTRVFVRDLSVLKRLAETEAGTRAAGPRASPDRVGPRTSAGAGSAQRGAGSRAGPKAGPAPRSEARSNAGPEAGPAPRSTAGSTTASTGRPEAGPGRSTAGSTTASAGEPEARERKAPSGEASEARAIRAVEASAGPAPTRPAKAASGPRRRRRGPEASSLFARWFWLVYLPLGLTGAVLLLAFTGLLPGALRVPLIVLTGLWSALALRLLIERRRRGVAVPAPRSILFGIAAVATLALGGGLLAWIGIGRVSSSEGLAMLLIGCFFMLMAVFAPMFKLVDSALRLVARLLSRRSTSPEAPPGRPVPPGVPPAESTRAASSSQPEPS